MSSEEADLLRRPRVMRSVGPATGSPMLAGRDLFNVSTNAKIGLERPERRSGGGAGEWKVTVEKELPTSWSPGTAMASPLVIESPLPHPLVPF